VIEQQQTRTFFVLLRIEDHCAVVTVVARAGKRRLNFCRAAEHFCAVAEIQGVQTLGIAARTVFAHGHDVNDAPRSIDHRRGRNADLRCHLTAAAIVGSGFSRFEERNLPERCAGISVKPVNAVVLAGHDEKIVSAFARDGDCRDVERLSIYLAVCCESEQLAECR